MFGRTAKAGAFVPVRTPTRFPSAFLAPARLCFVLDGWRVAVFHD
jgi:hypothetical protein